MIGIKLQPGKPQRAARQHASGLIIGLIGLLYGAQGVTQTAQQAMATVWNIPMYQHTGFLPPARAQPDQGCWSSAGRSS